MEKVDNIQKQVSNVSREMEILKQSLKEMLELKHTATEVKKAFYGLLSRLDTNREVISKIEGICIVTPSLKSKENKDWGGGGEQNRVRKHYGTITKSVGP